MDQMQLGKIIGLMVVLYLALLLGIARYLETKHASVWKNLGSPSLLSWSITSSSRLGKYVFLSGGHKLLHDQKLSLVIYFERALIAIMVAATIIWKLR